jgi:hypothetical protein
MAGGSDWPEIGADALDPPPHAGQIRWPWLPRRRPALGVRSTIAPSLLFVLLGVLLGPDGVNVMSLAVVNRLDMLVSVALAVLGVFVGLGATTIPRESARRTIVGGVAGSVAAMLIVAGGLGLLLRSWGLPLPMDVLTFAAIVGICASASAAVHRGTNPALRRAAYLADMDDIPLIVLGTVAIAMLGDGSAGLAVLRLALTIAAGGGIGLAGWLLFERAAGAAERGVFVTGAVLLIAGAGAYLGTSPLLAGGIASLVWARTPGTADRISVADLRVLQHPLLSLLLIVAGALIEWSPAILWITVAVVLLRLMGKLLASFAVAPLLRIRPALLASALLPPGVLGIALALNVRQVLGGDAGAIVAVVTVAAATSELVAMFLPADGGTGS